MYSSKSDIHWFRAVQLTYIVYNSATDLDLYTAGQVTYSKLAGQLTYSNVEQDNWPTEL